VLVHAPVHKAAGTAASVASQAFGYGHPATAVTPGAVSAGLYQPFPPSIVAVGVDTGNVSVGNVGTGPVAVYVGSTAALAIPPTEGGGHWP